MASTKWILLAILQCAACAAWGQESLGDVLDKSGRLLSVEELKAELVAHWISWQSPNGMLEISVRPNDGGNLQGQVRSIRGACTDFTGTWKLGNAGRFCMAATYRCGSSNNSFDTCPYWFKAGDEYWSSPSDSDRLAKVLKRSVKP